MSKKTLINEELLKVLVCPLSKGELIYDEKTEELICKESKLAYSVKNGIPIMLINQARKIED